MSYASLKPSNLQFCLSSSVQNIFNISFGIPRKFMIVKKTFGTWIVNWIQTSRMKLMHLPILQCTSRLIFYRFSSKFCDFIWQTVLVCWYLLFIIQRWYHVKWPPLANTARAGHTPSFEMKCKNVYTHSTYIIWKWSTINLLTSLMNFDLFSSSYTSYIMCRDENKCIEIQNTKMNKPQKL